MSMQYILISILLVLQKIYNIQTAPMSDKIYDQALDNSIVQLNQSPTKLQPKGKFKLEPLKSEPSQLGEPITVSPQKFINKKKVPKGYELADFDAAIQYWNKRNYSRKVKNEEGETSYETYSIFDDLEKLKEYGLGIFLYLQLLKQLLITCLIISVINLLPMYTFYNDVGLQNYPDSFTLTLAKFTIGNLVEAGQKQYLSVVVCDILTMIVLFGFYLRWKSVHNQVVEESQLDHKILNPTLYALTVTNFDPKTPNLQKSLKGYFDSMFHGAYEVQVIYNYKRNFNKFISMEQIIQKIQKQKQVMKQTDKSNSELIELEKQLDQMEQQIAQVIQDFQPIQAIVHFRNLKAKYSFINLCKKYSLVDKFGYKIKRCLCCVPGLPQRQKFLNQYDLMINSNNLARPDQINWNNLDITFISKAARLIISLILIIITMFITSSLICFCTLYVSSSASCNDYDISTTLQMAKNGSQQLLYCFCSQNLGSIFTDNQLQAICGGLTEDIAITNIVQIGASLVSAISNVILIVVVSLVAQLLYKPDSKPKQFSFIFVFVFLSNYINSTLLPLVLNGNIDGFVSVNYLRFVSFINFETVAIFEDFDRDWFAVISPYYTNFFIIGAISPLIQFVVFYFKRKFALYLTRRHCQNSDPQHPYIQKEVNQTITMFPFDYPTDVAVVCLQLFMCYMYSGLIPLAMPIFTFGLLLSIIFKRYVILNYTVRIPADESLNQKVVNLLPFIILIHGLFSVWSHTVEGFFNFEVFFINIELPANPGEIATRAMNDIIQLGATGLILIWIIADWTIFALCGMLAQSCKDQLQLPVSLASLENENYAERVKNSNILGSYKLSKNPTFGHPYRAYRQLLKRIQRKGQNDKHDDQSSMRDETVHNLVQN